MAQSWQARKFAHRLGYLPLIAATGLVCLWGQTSATSGSDPSGSSTGNASGTSPSPATQPAAGPAPRTGATRAIFLSGVVMMDDGSPLPGSVNILSICGGLRRIMGHTTGTGSFSFQWVSTTSIFGDASQAGRVPGSGGSSSLTGSRNGSRGLNPLSNCDLVAEFPAYSSGKTSLYDRGDQDNFDVGVIVLHRVAAGEGYSVSVTALQAPKEAKKSFGKGTSLAAANRLTEALASFESAVAVYPQYADAWLAIGKIQWQTGHEDKARTSFVKSMELDNKLVGPWQELGYLACDESRWEDAARYLDQAVRLEPLDSPLPWYFSALANYNLGQFDQAERSVRAELKLDRGRNPQAGYLLGLILIARRDLRGGAEALRNYIESAPASPDVAMAKRELSRLENSPGQ